MDVILSHVQDLYLRDNNNYKHDALPQYEHVDHSHLQTCTCTSDNMPDVSSYNFQGISPKQKFEMSCNDHNSSYIGYFQSISYIRSNSSMVYGL